MDTMRLLHAARTAGLTVEAVGDKLIITGCGEDEDLVLALLNVKRKVVEILERERRAENLLAEVVADVGDLMRSSDAVWWPEGDRRRWGESMVEICQQEGIWERLPDDVRSWISTMRDCGRAVTAWV